MRVETVQHSDPSPAIVQVARWAGVGLLFWVAGLALDQLEIYTGNAGIWPLLALFLPYVAIASVLLFSHHRVGNEASPAPVVLAVLLVIASLALVLRVWTADEGVMGPVYGQGIWAALQILVSLGLPMAVLLVLLTQREGRMGEVMPRVALGVGILVTLGSWAVSVRNVLELDGPDTWRIVSGFVPAHAIGFVLILAGLRVIRPKVVRAATFCLAGLVVGSALASTANWLSFGASVVAWNVATNLAIRAAYVVLLLAFGGLLTRASGYAAAAVVLLAVVIASIGMTIQVFDSEATNWFWVPTFGVVTVLSTLLIALVTVEVTRVRGDLIPGPSRS